MLAEVVVVAAVVVFVVVLVVVLKGVGVVQRLCMLFREVTEESPLDMFNVPYVIHWLPAWSYQRISSR